MQHDWSSLRNELAACRREGIAVKLWWRDDDATAPTPALDQLSALSEDTGVPVHLAVIPAHATPALADHMDGARLVPLVHGWAHQDHSTADEKKNEFMTVRPGRTEETAHALAKMRVLFGPVLRPMFVPPWNRIDPGLLPALSSQGYTALSTFGARDARHPTPGLTQINTHIDPIWWKRTRDLVDPAILIEQATRHLHARRIGGEDGEEPLGLLTHHLVHTPAIWAFSESFLYEMLSGGATPWTMETT